MTKKLMTRKFVQIRKRLRILVWSFRYIAIFFHFHLNIRRPFTLNLSSNNEFTSLSQFREAGLTDSRSRKSKLLGLIFNRHLALFWNELIVAVGKDLL